MRHKSVAISVAGLQDRVWADSDNFGLADALGIEGGTTDDWWAAHCIDWVVVTWPDHVVNARYNSDAHYSCPMRESEARAQADAINSAYGDC